MSRRTRHGPRILSVASPAAGFAAGASTLDNDFFLTIAELAVAPSGWAALDLTLGLLLAGLIGLTPLRPASGLALVVELSVAATMFLRVASSPMSAHPPSED